MPINIFCLSSLIRYLLLQLWPWPTTTNITFWVYLSAGWGQVSFPSSRRLSRPARCAAADWNCEVWRCCFSSRLLTTLKWSHHVTCQIIEQCIRTVIIHHLQKNIGCCDSSYHHIHLTLPSGAESKCIAPTTTPHSKRQSETRCHGPAFLILEAEKSEKMTMELY